MTIGPHRARSSRVRRCDDLALNAGVDVTIAARPRSGRRYRRRLLAAALTSPPLPRCCPTASFRVLRSTISARGATPPRPYSPRRSRGVARERPLRGAVLHRPPRAAPPSRSRWSSGPPRSCLSRLDGRRRAENVLEARRALDTCRRQAEALRLRVVDEPRLRRCRRRRSHLPGGRPLSRHAGWPRAPDCPRPGATLDLFHPSPGGWATPSSAPAHATSPAPAAARARHRVAASSRSSRPRAAAPPSPDHEYGSPASFRRHLGWSRTSRRHRRDQTSSTAARWAARATRWPTLRAGERRRRDAAVNAAAVVNAEGDRVVRLHGDPPFAS